jgi:hypothetical protein
MHAPISKASKYVKQKLIELCEEIDTSTNVLEIFILLSQ